MCGETTAALRDLMACITSGFLEDLQWTSMSIPLQIQGSVGRAPEPQKSPKDNIRESKKCNVSSLYAEKKVFPHMIVPRIYFCWQWSRLTQSKEFLCILFGYIWFVIIHDCILGCVYMQGTTSHIFMVQLLKAKLTSEPNLQWNMLSWWSSEAQWGRCIGPFLVLVIFIEGS